METIAQACKEWGITRLCWEADTEPYAVKRDREVRAVAESAGIAVESPVGHTLYDSAALIKVAGGKAPSSMKVFSFCMYTAAIAIDAIDVTLLAKQQAHVCISLMMMSCEWTLPLRLGEALHIAFEHFGGRGPVAIDVTAVCVHQGFEALAAKAGAPAQPLPDPPQQLPAVHPAGAAADTSIPSAHELGYSGTATSAFKVGKQQQTSKGRARSMTSMTVSPAAQMCIYRDCIRRHGGRTVLHGSHFAIRICDRCRSQVYAVHGGGTGRRECSACEAR